METLISVFPATFPVLIPLGFIIFFYSMIGLYTFKGIFENRCRETEFPLPDNTWPVVPSQRTLCGPYKCSSGYCGSPYDYDIPWNSSERNIPSLTNGVSHFDNMLVSIFTISHHILVVDSSLFSKMVIRKKIP